jgi:hypothetical protein
MSGKTRCQEKVNDRETGRQRLCKRKTHGLYCHQHCASIDWDSEVGRYCGACARQMSMWAIGMIDEPSLPVQNYLMGTNN